MKNRRKMCLVILLIALPVLVGSSIYGAKRNYNHNRAKENTLNLIQQRIDEGLAEINYMTNEYELNGNCYYGRIYIVNENAGLEFVKRVLKNCIPIYEEINYEPTDIHIFIGGVDIGYAGSTDYYWPDNDGKAYGFRLPEKYNTELWEYLSSLENE